MMRILWLDINSSFSHSNLGFPSLHSMLREENKKEIEWMKLSGVINSSESDLIKEILLIKPDMIMATAWLFNHNFLKSVLSDIKSLLPEIGVFLGGPEFLGTSAENKDYLTKNPFIDFIFRGDGEESFDGIISAIKNDFDNYKELWVQKIKIQKRKFNGFCYFSENEYLDGGCANVENFSALKVPEESEFFDWSKPFVQLETSRGCFNSCAFCVSGIQSKIQNLSIENLRTRLKNILAKGIHEIRVLDRTFNAHPARALELLDLFEEFAGQMRFHIEVHPAFIREDVFQRMEGLPLGLLHIEVGVQSLSDEVLKMAARKGSAQAALDGIKRIIAGGKFEVHSDLIVGLPGYSYPAMVEDSLKLMSTGVSEVQIETLKCLPGTRMRNEASSMGLKYSKNSPYQVLQTSWCSYEDILKAMTWSALVDDWYNSDETRSFFTECLNSVSDKLDFVDGLIEFHYAKGRLGKVLSKESRWMLFYEYLCDSWKELLPFMAVAWISAGLSLKKEPASLLVPWKFNSSVENPVFVEDKPTYAYYFIDMPKGNPSSRVWICYDRATRSCIFKKSF